MNYVVYQLPTGHDAVYMDLWFVQKYQKEHELSQTDLLHEYQKVYEGDFDNLVSGPDFRHLPKEEMLDIIFEALNIYHPEDYRARSLSVSDIILIEDEYWFCDSFGWEKLEV